jgi:putative transposase
MVTFYRSPKAHWLHLRTSNVVESPFSAVRPRTAVAKRYNKVAHAEALIQEILPIAEKRFRCLNAPSVLKTVYVGTKFLDGVGVKAAQRRLAA